jgi:hypothetical protein
MRTATFVREAAQRLQALDVKQPDRNGVDLLITASGGYGSHKQAAMLADIRTLVSYMLNDDPPQDVA